MPQFFQDDANDELTATDELNVRLEAALAKAQKDLAAARASGPAVGSDGVDPRVVRKLTNKVQVLEEQLREAVTLKNQVLKDKRKLAADLRAVTFTGMPIFFLVRIGVCMFCARVWTLPTLVSPGRGLNLLGLRFWCSWMISLPSVPTPVPARSQ